MEYSLFSDYTLTYFLFFSLRNLLHVQKCPRGI
nr:MAG TPA: hypothetical protein [Caudoviricetes sp.]